MSRALLSMLALLAGCEKEPSPPSETEPLPGDPDYVRDESLDVSLQSEADSVMSHQTGQACMHCHQPHSNGRGLFSAAGSVYGSDGEPATEGSVQLWAEGELLLELPIDGLGNFYTTAELGLPEVAVQPVLLDAAGEVVNQMPWPTESASCNQCHTPVMRVILP
jgi:hypothetical protein